jgi:hypothetical protein
MRVCLLVYVLSHCGNAKPSFGAGSTVRWRASTTSSRQRITARNPLDDESAFERYEVLRGILDCGTSDAEVNQLVSLLLGYGPHSPYVDDERARAWQTEFPMLPDLFGEKSDAFSRVEAEIPDDEEQLASMQVLFEAMYGETAVQMAQSSGEPAFARRSAIVSWMVLTTDYWSDMVARRG